jgi:mannonate dehydratase
MRVGTQQASPSDDMLRYFAQFGVRNICGTPPKPGPKGSWEVADLVRLRERVESFGINLDLLPLPMGSWPVSRSESPNIMLGKSPERDREIEIICDNIRAASKAGIPALKYNLTLLGVVRTERTPGRGGSSTRHDRVVGRRECLFFGLARRDEHADDAASPGYRRR